MDFHCKGKGETGVQSQTKEESGACKEYRIMMVVIAPNMYIKLVFLAFYPTKGM